MKNLLIVLFIAASCSVFGQTWHFDKVEDDFTDEVSYGAWCFGTGEFPFEKPLISVAEQDGEIYIGVADAGVFNNDGLTFKIRVDKGFVYTTEHMYVTSSNDCLYLIDFTTGGERSRNLMDLVNDMKNGSSIKLYVSYDYGSYTMDFPLRGSESAINKVLNINQ
tara:strand:+ start:65 stop:556 length:492 start_codon:yes stop_codon:yes gene_type:complete